MAKRKAKKSEARASPAVHKSTPRPKKTDYRFVWWIVAVVAIVVIILMIRGREAPVAEEPVVMPEPEPEPTPEPEPEPVLTPEETVVSQGGEVTETVVKEKTEKGLAVDVKSAEGFGLSCAEMGDGTKKITLTVKNTGEIDWHFVKTDEFNKNVGIMNRGIADPTPGCDKNTIAPGETAVCSSIDAGIITGENRVSLSAPNKINLAGFVECP